MKYAIIFLLLLTTSSAAGAEPFTGGAVTVEVPEGWTAEHRKKGLATQIRLIDRDNQFRVAIILGASKGGDTKTDAEQLAKKLGRSTAPEPVPGRDSYHFFSQTEMEVIVFTRYPVIFIWMQRDGTEKYAGDLRSIWNSLGSSNQFYQTLIDELYKL